ncbi:MAG TPA: hypothetical protein VGD64_01235 [Acidisarcina sp.]
MISELYFHSESEAKPLSVAVMVDSFRLAAAFRQVLNDIAKSDFAHLALVIVNKEATHPASVASESLGGWRRPKGRRSIVYDYFQKHDRRREYGPSATQAVDCSDLLGACARLDVSPVAEGAGHRFPGDAISALRGLDLDVVLRFGFRPLRGEVLGIARCGVWTYHYGASELNSGVPTLFWEVVHDEACSEVSLQASTREGAENVVLCRSIFPTVRGVSPSRNLFQPIWGSTHMVIRKLNELHQAGWDSLLSQSSPPSHGRPELQHIPTNREMAAWLTRHVGEELNTRYNRWRIRRTDEWRICIRRADFPNLIMDTPKDKSDFRWLPCPAGHYYADPMLYEHEGHVWIFFEDYIYKEARGRLCCALVNPDGTFGEVSVCLDLAYHLSYPFVFDHEGEIFMIPESVASGRVELWRATRFPFDWKLEKVLFEGLCVDTTPLFHHGHWYFFTALLSRLKTHAAFGALFHAESLTGEWARHPVNPISTDVRNARPGGGVVKVDGRLLRPVQDCGERYGRRLHTDEILELTPETYRARRLHKIEADWDRESHGIHTYGFCAGWEVIDLVRRRDRRLV